MNARETYFWAVAIKNALAEAIEGDAKEGIPGYRNCAIAEMEQSGILKAKVGPGYVVAAQKDGAVVDDLFAFRTWMRRNGYITAHRDFDAAVLTDAEYEDLVDYVAIRYPRAIVEKPVEGFSPSQAVEGPDGTCVDPSTGELVDGLSWHRGTAYLKCVDSKNRKLSTKTLRFNAPPNIRGLITGEAFADQPVIDVEDYDE